MKYKVVSAKDTGRVTQMMQKINEVSHVQMLERGPSGDERTDSGSRFPVEGEALASKRASELLLLFVLNENAGGREQTFG